MKSPFGWCLIAAFFVAPWSGLAEAQNDDSSSELSDPFIPTEPATGLRFQADALIWTRNSQRSNLPIIGGPETFSLNGLNNYSYTGGYRIGLGYLIDPNYEAEVVWTQFSDWTGNGAGVLTRAVAFNGGQASTLVDPTGNANFINTSTYFRPIYDAASDPLSNPAIQNYDFLKAGGQYAMHSQSNLYDIQANFKTRRSVDQPFSFGVGYRNIHLGDNADAVVSGTFGTSDLPAGGTTHNVLTDQALVDHGLTLISGAADGFTNNPAGPATTLSMLWNGSTQNQLNGVQGTADATLLEKGPLSLEGVLRTGLFYNQMTGTVREVYAAGGADNSVYGRTLTDRRDTVSFASNIGLNGVIQIGNRVRIRTGYEAMFLTNTAVAANQQQGVVYNSLGQASYSIRGGSAVILHGARIGLEVVW